MYNLYKAGACPQLRVFQRCRERLKLCYSVNDFSYTFSPHVSKETMVLGG